jgi:hypothetical protein
VIETFNLLVSIHSLNCLSIDLNATHFGTLRLFALERERERERVIQIDGVDIEVARE